MTCVFPVVRQAGLQFRDLLVGAGAVRVSGWIAGAGTGAVTSAGLQHHQLIVQTIGLDCGDLP